MFNKFYTKINDSPKTMIKIIICTLNCLLENINLNLLFLFLSFCKYSPNLIK